MALPLADSSALSIGKRKRNEVCYAEQEALDFDDDCYLMDDVAMADVDIAETDDDDDDGEYGRRRSKRTTKARKQARLTSPPHKKTVPQKPFPFMSLPPELRNEIYNLALCEQDGMLLECKTKMFRRTVIRCRLPFINANYVRRTCDDVACAQAGAYDGDSCAPPEPVVLSPNLLAVSRQIHQEAAHHLYKQQISLADTTVLQAFLANIGPGNRQLLSDIVILGWGRGRGVYKGNNFSSFNLLATCVNLKSVHLDCTLKFQRGTPRSLAQLIYRNGFSFLHDFAAANGGCDAAIDVLHLRDQNFNPDHHHHYYWRRTREDASEAFDLPEYKAAFYKELRSLMINRDGQHLKDRKKA